MTLDLETIEARYEILLDEPDAPEILQMGPERRCFVVHACKDILTLVAEVERLRALVPEPALLRRLAGYADAAFRYDLEGSCHGYPGDEYEDDACLCEELVRHISDYEG